MREQNGWRNKFPFVLFVSRIILLLIVFYATIFLCGIVDVSAVASDGHGAQALKNPDGTWKWTNKLVNETSPYLLLHAHNPVDWYPWGAEALERARTEDKPIFLSVGYSTCYWCHVMERKVFANPQIAAMMNEMYINIKVDREERPDLDEIYMTATQIMTRGGGWPNSVFLTPDLHPFYAGTYFPPADSHGRPGFPRVLKALHDHWVNQRDDVIEHGMKITEVIRQATGGALSETNESLPEGKLVSSAIEFLRSTYSPAYGGFGDAPLFPSPTNLELLLSEYDFAEDEQLLEMVTHTLDMMAYGGIYDQIGGGFHRYSVDSRWLVPHFEKMLYDNAQLAKVYLLAYQRTRKPLYRRVAEEIFEFVFREMTSPEGGFYSAIDAETDTEEGKYYVWTQEEIRDVLGRRKSTLLMKVYGVTKGPNFEGKNILYLPTPIANAAKAEGKSEEELLAQLEPLKAQLLNAREKRERPLLDTKVIVNWNGLMIDAFALGYEVIKDARYRYAAEQAAIFILEKMKNPDGGLMHTYRDGVLKYDGYLDDYAFLVRGLLGLYQATNDKRWLNEARDLTDTMVGLFWDDADGAFYFTLEGAEHLLVRTKKPYDSAIPSGNAVAANNLLTIAALTGERNYLKLAEKTLGAFAGMMSKSSGGFMHMLLAANRYLAEDWTAPQDTPSFVSALRNQQLRLPSADSPLTSGAEIVTAAASLKSGGKITWSHPFEVEIHLEIAEGWHVNANPASQDMLIPTTVSLNADAPATVVSVNYPEGDIAHFDFSEVSLSVYEGKIAILMKLQLKSGASYENAFPLELELHYQACNDQICLQPTTRKIKLIK